MICTPCGQQVEDGYEVLVGVEREGKLSFVWACCHRPIGDGAVYLASQECMVAWSIDHPEYREQIREAVRSRRECQLHSRSRGQ